MLVAKEQQFIVPELSDRLQIETVIPVGHDRLLIHYQSDQSAFQSILAIYQKSGQIVWEKEYDCKLTKIAVPRPNQLLVCQSFRHTLAIQFFETKQTIDINLNLEYSNKVTFQYFGGSDLVAILQEHFQPLKVEQLLWSRSSYIYSIYYYPYEQLQKGQPYLSTGNSKTQYIHNIQKLNNSSQLGEIFPSNKQFKSNQHLKLNIISFDTKTLKITTRTITTVNCLKDIFDLDNNVSLCCPQIKEFKRNKYLIHAQTSIDPLEQRIITKKQAGLPVYSSIFLVNSSQSKTNAVIQCLLKIPIAYADSHFVCSLTGNWIKYIFQPKYSQERKKCWKRPSISMNCSDYEKAAVLIQQHDPVKKVFPSPDTDQNTMVQSVSIYNRGLSWSDLLTKDNMIRVRQYRSAKQVYMHFLLCIYEDFDDDILQDAIQLATK